MPKVIVALQPITIVGGGVAGLSLGIALRREGIPVKLIESGSYPRHRVCGEFISGGGMEILERLEVLPLLRRAGGREASTAQFHLNDRVIPERLLPQKAFCVSRFVLDSVLSEFLTRLGGTLALRERWTNPFNAPGIVRATGRRVAGGDLARRWFGLKAHARGVLLQSDLEMHMGARGYVGLCRVEGDRVNVCGLFRGPPPGSTTRVDLLERFTSGLGKALRERLSSASWDEDSYCAVGGLPVHLGLRPQGTAEDEFAIGDTVGMIPPLTGNGMSLALESAWLAKEPLVEFSRGEIEWSACCTRMALLLERAFGARLGRANRLHQILTSDSASLRCLAILGTRWRFAWNWAFRATR